MQTTQTTVSISQSANETLSDIAYSNGVSKRQILIFMIAELKENAGFQSKIIEAVAAKQGSDIPVYVPASIRNKLANFTHEELMLLLDAKMSSKQD